METNIVKWWKNKWVVLLMVVGILTVVVGFLFAYFISWGWILALVLAVVGGIGMMFILFKIIEIYSGKNKI